MLNNKRLVNFSLKIVSLFSKFILLYILTKYLSVESLGDYGLIFSFVGFATVFLSFEIYTEYSRDIVLICKNERYGELYSLLIQFTIPILVLYCAILFLLMVIAFFFEEFSIEWILLITCLSLAEQYSLELMRIFNSMNLQLVASVNLLIRTSFWIYPLIFVAGSGELTLITICIYWLIGAVLSIVFSLGYIFYYCGRRNFVVNGIFTWFFQKVKIALPLFISAIIVRFLPFSERIALEGFVSLSTVGVYTIFSSFTNVIYTLLEALFIVFYVPKMLLLNAELQYEKLRSISSELLRILFVCGVFLGVTFFLSSTYVFQVIDKPELNEYGLELGLMLINLVIILCSTAVHLYLYTLGRYTLIYKIMLFYAVQSLLLIFVLGSLYGFIGVVLATTLSNLTLFFVRCYFSYVG